MLHDLFQVVGAGIAAGLLVLVSMSATALVAYGLLSL